MMRMLLAVLVSQPSLFGIRHRYITQHRRYPDEGSSRAFLDQQREASGVKVSKKARGKRSVHNRGVIKRRRSWAEEEQRPTKRQHTMPYEQIYPMFTPSNLTKRERTWSTDDERDIYKRPCQQEKEFQPNNLLKRKIGELDQRTTEEPLCKRLRAKRTLDDSTKRKIHWLIPVPPKRLRLWKQHTLPSFWEIIENLDSESDQIQYMQDAIARGEDINACKEIKINSEQAIHVTALNQLIYTNRAKFIEFLLKSGADVNKVSQMAIIMGMNTICIESETPLDTAVKLDKATIARLLLTYKAEITQKTKAYARCYASPELRNLIGVG